MYDNHRHHALFMANVFESNDFNLLATVLPWVYRTYVNQGFSYDYFPVELQAWQQAIQHHLTAADAAPILRVYDWMLSAHPVLQASSQTPPPRKLLDPQAKHTIDQMVKAILWGDFQESLRLAKSQVKHANDLPSFFHSVVQPTMYEVGWLWENGDINVAQEHLASATMMRLLSSIYALVEIPPRAKGRIVVTAAPNEFHEIGAWLVANSLELDGWEVVYLGSNTPQTDLLNLLKLFKPNILAISVAMPFNLDRVRQIVEKVRTETWQHTPKILLGGLALNTFPSLIKDLGGDAWAADCLQAVTQANAWHTETA